MKNALKKANPDIFLDEEFGPIKKEIEDIFQNVMSTLNHLSHVAYNPKKLGEKTEIRTQNVPSIIMEEVVPFSVSKDKGIKAKRERIEINKEEMTKEEKKSARQRKKRHIKAHRKSKEMAKKEKDRAEGVAKVGDRFLMKNIQDKINKQKKEDKKALM